ncbi:hypothetical protein F66182_9781 [Fusarium sp. NRRL 66182]|nr:hypothetical protein F66182_9781 [Fusarium sp. NRRL 66182]
MTTRLRNANPCDGCALRRVKCEEGRPCHECRIRGIECTVLRARKKRGPKGGPRSTTKAKVERFQKSITNLNNQSLNGAEIADQDNSDSPSGSSRSPPRPPYRLPLDEYQRILDISKQKTYSIWPVFNADHLLTNIKDNDQDYESHALAASLCAATIAQLRLPEHAGPRNTPSSLQFAAECLQLRELYDYRETFTVASILIPFFLHVYYANANKLRTSGLFLRETVTYVQLMQLGDVETYSHLAKQEQALRIRVYWLMLISERTYSAQHGLQAVLQVISVFPDKKDDIEDEHLIQSFSSLTRLFAYLESNLTTASSDQQPLERQKLVSYQAALCLDSYDHAAREAQRVDLFVTRQWIRLLLWEYTARHFLMSCHPDNEAFSLFLPVKIGHEMLSLFSMVTSAAIKTHGYGIELKVFRLADAMLDIVACTPLSARGDGMLLGSGDILCSFQHVLHAVGGRESLFLRKIHNLTKHFHPNTHECYGVIQGGSELIFGAGGADSPDVGVRVPVHLGDVIVVPAGVSHASIHEDNKTKDKSERYRYIGVYPVESPHWRNEFGKVPLAEKSDVVEESSRVPIPQDPLSGDGGPLMRLWRAAQGSR